MQQGCPFLLLSVVTKATATLLFLFHFSSLAAYIVISHTRCVQCNQMRSCKQTSRTNLPLLPQSHFKKRKSLTFCTQSLLQRSRTRPLWQRTLTWSLFRCLFAYGHCFAACLHGHFFAVFSHMVAFAAFPHTVAFSLPFRTQSLSLPFRTRSLSLPFA